MLIRKSFAKINLYLEILGNNPKGYHLLDSLLAYVDIKDEIEVTASDRLELIIKGENSKLLEQNNSENIIIKTVNLLAKKFNIIPKIKITLTKNIPLAAGLGGGSSNAATIFLILNEFYNLNLSGEKLKEISLEIGSDIAFCLHQKMALVSGIGEKITDVKIKSENFLALIINPRKTLSTKEVFELFNLKYKKNSKTKSAVKLKDNTELITAIENRHNHLEKAAIEILPEIAAILKTLKKQQNCLISRMSGSGATCFGLFKNQADLNQAEINLRRQFPEFYIKKSKLIYEL